MKKLITAILCAAMILMSFSSSFAAVSISKVFVDEDGTHFFFGRFDYSKAEDAGIEVNGKDYNLNRSGDMDYNDLPENLWESAKRNGRFGIGLKDSDGILGNGTTEVKPYEVIDGEKVYGESAAFDGGAAKTPVADEIISSITVGEEVLKGVDSSIFDYYYGLSKLPDSADGLPSVTVETENEAVVGDAVSELGGFTKTVTINYGGKTYEYNIYFRQAETVTLTNTKLLSSKGGWVRNDGTDYAIINSAEYGYAEFSAEAFSGLDYIITGASVNANFKYNLEEITVGVSAYDSAEMLIGDVGEFLNREFVNFRTAGSTAPENNNTFYDIELDYSKFREEGDNILLAFRKNGTSSTYVYDPKLTVSYVLKNPGLTDSTLKEIKIDGVALEGFDPNVTEYYVGVEDPEGEHIITAVPSYGESIVTVSGNTVTVKPLVGESKVYTINFREIKTLTLTASQGGILRINDQFQTGNSGPKAILPTHNWHTSLTIEQEYVGYQEFDLSGLPADIVITNAEITSDIFYSAYAPSAIYWHRSAFDTFASVKSGGYHKEFSGQWTEERKPVELGSFTIDEVIPVNTHKYYTARLDASKLNIVDGKIVLAATKGFGEEYSDSMVYMAPKSDLTVKYVEKNPGASDASLKEIKINGVALECFDPEITEYYVPVESLDIFNVITATAKYPTSEVTVSENTIIVKPMVGESKVYTINFREVQTLMLTATQGGILRINGQIQTGNSGPKAILPTHNWHTSLTIEQEYVGYQEFDFSALPEEAVITDVEITSDIFYSAVAPTAIYWHRSAFDTFASVKSDGYHKEFSGKWTDERKPVQLGSFIIDEAIPVNTHKYFTAKLDVSALNIVDNKIVLAATKGFGEEYSDNMPYMAPRSDLAVKYIVR